MYLSRLELDVSRRETMIALGAPSLFHGAIESAFPGERQRRLWRLDDLNDRKYLLVLSEKAPDLSNAAAQFSAEGVKAETRDYTLLLNKCVKGTKWRFRLTANPTYSVPNENGRGRVCAHTTTEHQRQWLMKQSEKHGFALEENSFDVTRVKWYQFGKGSSRKRVSMLSVTYEGILTVTDDAMFRKALTDGIGREKAYGAGLMTLMRA